MILQIKSLNSYYGNVHVLRDLELTVSPGEVLCMLGRNGAGKTTILKSVMGLVRMQGSVTMGGHEIAQLPPHEIPKMGVGYVPQGRRLFSELTVEENLEIGLMVRKQGRSTLDSVFELFPVLEQRLRQVSGTLSGGEQQMLAMARALCIQPGVLLLDEPTEGLMPSMIRTIRDSIKTLRERGVAILLVEQRVDAVLPVADRVAFIESGSLQAEVTSQQLGDQPELIHRYIGI
ncbi:MAG: ABC transporter ATP-binding protein [Pseudomonadota bacterium]